jgi:hypothetical protein
MTGFDSKRQAAKAKLNDDDDTQVYADTLLIVYQRGFADGKKAQRKWQGLTEQDMPSGEDPMFDHQYFCAGMVYAAKVLQEKNT